MPNPTHHSGADSSPGFRILAAVEDRSEEVATLRRALTWHRTLPGPLEILRVIPGDTLDTHEGQGALQTLNSLAASAGARTEDEVTFEIEPGKAADVIRERATHPACHLLVLGRSATPSLADRWFGGVAESLLNRPPCPMLLPGMLNDPAPKTDLDRVLLLSDASIASRSAFPMATRVVEAFDASLTIVHVCAPESLPGEQEYERHGPYIEALRRERQESFSRWLEENAEMLPPRRLIRMLEGYPYEAVCRYATTTHADLIILGSRGHSGWKGLTGGTAMRIARNAPCPVLFVPSSQYP